MEALGTHISSNTTIHYFMIEIVLPQKKKNKSQNIQEALQNWSQGLLIKGYSGAFQVY